MATVQGNYRLTAEGADNDVRHIILDLGAQPFPVLEGQSVGIIAPGARRRRQAALAAALFRIEPARRRAAEFQQSLADGEARARRRLLQLCLRSAKGDKVRLVGPFGATFLMPSDPKAQLLMICTGTGSAPFRAFTMRRQREGAH